QGEQGNGIPARNDAAADPQHHQSPPTRRRHWSVRMLVVMSVSVIAMFMVVMVVVVSVAMMMVVMMSAAQVNVIGPAAQPLEQEPDTQARDDQAHHQAQAGLQGAGIEAGSGRRGRWVRFIRRGHWKIGVRGCLRARNREANFETPQLVLVARLQI